MTTPVRLTDILSTSGGAGLALYHHFDAVSVLLGTESPVTYSCPPATAPVADLVPSPQFWRLVWRLDQLRSSEAPDDAAFRDARVFFDRLPFPLVALPHISLADDGEMNFVWDCGSVHIDLGFYGTGTFSYYARGTNGQEYYGDDVLGRHPLPVALASLLRA